NVSMNVFVFQAEDGIRVFHVSGVQTCALPISEMYKYLTGYQNLLHSARMIPGISRQRIDEVTALVGLTGRIHDKVKTYSLGMRRSEERRVGDVWSSRCGHGGRDRNRVGVGKGQ